MMNFDEYNARVNGDARLTLLLTAYDEDPSSLTDEELNEMIDRFDAFEDPLYYESPVDLFGPWWE